MERNICKPVDRLSKNMDCGAHKIVTHLVIYFCKLLSTGKCRCISANSSPSPATHNRIFQNPKQLLKIQRPAQICHSAWAGRDSIFLPAADSNEPRAHHHPRIALPICKSRVTPLVDTSLYVPCRSGRVRRKYSRRASCFN